MSTKAAKAIGLPPGLNFHLDDDELVEFFLLPTVRGGVVIDDDDTREPGWLAADGGQEEELDEFVVVGVEVEAGRQPDGRGGLGRHGLVSCSWIVGGKTGSICCNDGSGCA